MSLDRVECTAKEKIFARYYAEDGCRNATEAACRAGWGNGGKNRKAAGTSACLALRDPRVQLEVEYQLKLIREQERPSMDRKRLRRRLENIAMARIDDFLDWNDGRPKAKPRSRIFGESFIGLQEAVVDERVTVTRAGDTITETRTKIKVKDGGKEAEHLMKMEGMLDPGRFPEKGDQAIPLSLILRHLTNEQLGLTEDGDTLDEGDEDDEE